MYGWCLGRHWAGYCRRLDSLVIFCLVLGSTPALVPTTVVVPAGRSFSPVTAWPVGKSGRTFTAISVTCTGGVGDLGPAKEFTFVSSAGSAN